MLLYVPVTRADYHLAAPLFRWMGKIGGLGDHPMVLAVAPSGIPGVEEDALVREALKLSPNVYRIDMGTFPELGWPRNPNFIFQEAAMYAVDNRAHNQKCWYFFELDNVPTREGWLDDLNEEYQYRDRPCMGVINDTVRVTPTGIQRITGKHMVGAGIYPVNYFSQARVCRHLHLLAEPFDVALETQTVPIAWHTKMIQHNWSTCKYRPDPNPKRNWLVCEHSKLRAASKDYAQPVDLGKRGPLVVHGCKDVSLIDALGKNLRNKPKPLPSENNANNL